MPRNINEAQDLIKQAQANYMYGVSQINKIRAGNSTGLVCNKCNEVETWKDYINSMHDWAERIRASQEIGMALTIKAEAGASLLIGGKLGVEVKDNNISFSYTSTYGTSGAEASITGGLSITNDPNGKMSSWTANAGGKYGAVYVVGANIKYDTKYIQVNVEGGLGAAAEVYFLPVSLEKEYSTSYKLPFNLGKKSIVYPTYNGAPTADEWIQMLNGGGW